MLGQAIAPAPPAPDDALAFGMTDLEDALRGPDGEQARHSALARIDAAVRRIQAHLEAGVDPRQIETIKIMQRSLLVARLIVTNAPQIEPSRREP